MGVSRPKTQEIGGADGNPPYSSEQTTHQEGVVAGATSENQKLDLNCKEGPGRGHSLGKSPMAATRVIGEGNKAVPYD